MTVRRLKCSPLEVFWRCYLGLFKSTATGESTRNNLNIGLIRDFGICKLMNEWGDFKQCLAVKRRKGWFLMQKAIWGRCVPRQFGVVRQTAGSGATWNPGASRPAPRAGLGPRPGRRSTLLSSGFGLGPLNSEHLSWHPRFLSVFAVRLLIREGPCRSPWDCVTIQYLLQASVGLSEPVPSLV